MRFTDKTPWLFVAALGAGAACGGVSDQNFYDGPAKRVAQAGGTGVGGSASLGGNAGHAPSGGGSTSASGGSVSTGGSSTAKGGDSTGGGSGGSGNATANGGSGNAPASGGSGDATATGGTGDVTSTGGTSAEGGAGDAPSGGTGGDVSTGGMGGTEPLAGMGGTTAGQTSTGGVGNVGGAGMAGAGGNAMGGRVGRGGGPGDDCTMKLKQLDDKLTAAQVCSRAQDSNCQGFVTNECGCKVPVNNPSSAAAKAYLAAVDDAMSCVACTDSICPSGSKAYCQADASVEGHCVAADFTPR